MEKKNKLNSSAKAFVPQSSMLNSSAAPWTPYTATTVEPGTSSSTTTVTGSSQVSKAAAATTTTPITVTKPSTSTTTTTPAAPVVTPVPSTTAPPKPPAPKPSAWGSKKSNAILTAPTPEQQAKQQQQQKQLQSQQQQSSNITKSNHHHRNSHNHHNHYHHKKHSHNNNDDHNKQQQSQQQPQQQQQWRNQKNDEGNWRNQKKGGEDSGHHHVGGRGGGRHHNLKHSKPDDQSTSNNNNSINNNDDGWTRGKSLPLDLLKPNDGKDEIEKAVTRIVAEELLSLRLSFLAPPLAWEDTNADKEVITTNGPPEECRWRSDTRVQEIDSMTNSKRLGGDVSSKKKKKDNETAPPLEECKPLEVNEETRWKAGVFKKDYKGSSSSTAANNGKDEDSDDVVLKKSLLILNKLSLTKFEKLSDAFIECGIGRNSACLAGAIQLIVKKAQDEPHFSAMYAALCLKLSKAPLAFEEDGKKKKFKKMLLTECQKEFEQDTDTKIELAVKGIDDEEERQNKANLVKKHYLGHMRFIGELYKGELINIKIMLMCLSALLESEPGNSDSRKVIDEEKVECFAKLMTVIGMILEQQSLNLKEVGKTESYENLARCWKVVQGMISGSEGPTISNRLKFMLQDLIEMRDNGWVQRREVESAKTIAQIHKEAAKEARRSSMNRSASNSSIRRQSSTNDVISIARSTSKPNVDADGFTEVSTARGFGRSQSLGSFARTDSKSSIKNPDKSRTVSSGGSFGAFNDISSSPRRDMQKNKSLPNVDEKIASTTQKNFKSPDECGKKFANYLKEYFVGGDTDDMVLSVHELIGAGSKGSIDRGSKVIESGVLMVLEMKEDNVKKFLTVISRCIAEKKIESESIISGLNEPLELLADIAIDAPLASSHLVSIVSKFIESGFISFDFLMDAPDFFRSDGGAARFGCKVLKNLGGDFISSQANIDVIEKLMTDSDKELFPGAKEMLS